MDMLMAASLTALAPLKALCTNLIAVMPSIITGLVLLLVGLWSCYWVRMLVDRVFKMIHVDDYSRKVGLSTVLYRLGLGPSLTYLVGTVASAVLFLSFFLGAAEAVGLSVIPQYLQRFISFGPRVLEAVLIVGGGLFLGDLLGRILSRAADANHVRGSEAIMRITHGLVVIFSGMMALEFLGFDLSLLMNSMQIIIASVGLGLAIAFGVSFGMAGRESAERWIRDLTPKSRLTTNGEAKHRVAR